MIKLIISVGIFSVNVLISSGPLEISKRYFRKSNFFIKRFTLSGYIFWPFLYIFWFYDLHRYVISWVCLRRWESSRQLPRPSSCSHPFRRHQDIYRKMSRKTDQKTLLLPFVELVIKFVIVIGWTLDPLSVILLLCNNIVQLSFSIDEWGAGVLNILQL